MVIRPFKTTDADELCKMILETLYKTNSKDYSKEILDKRAVKYTPAALTEKAKTRYILVAEERGRIVGSAQLDNEEIKMMFVLPEMQGRGVGKSLVEKIEEYAKGKGLKKIVGNSSLTAVGFYEKLGFVVGPEVEEDGIRGYIIEKRL